MAVQRLDNVGVVVDDLEAAIAFFLELGLELDGEAVVEGRWVDRVVGLDDVRADIAMVRTPDGHGRLELTKFHTPKAVGAGRRHRRTHWAYVASCSPSTTSPMSLPACRLWAPNSSVKWSGTRTSISSATCAAPRASSLRSPSSSAEE